MGKSSILNALIGEDRTIVSPISGTTRDAIDTEFTGPDGQVFQFDMWLPNVCFDSESVGMYLKTVFVTIPVFLRIDS